MFKFKEIWIKINVIRFKKRDYKTSERRIRVALKWHDDRVKELMESGMSKENSARMAIGEWFFLSKKEHNKLIKNFKERYW